MREKILLERDSITGRLYDQTGKYLATTPEVKGFIQGLPDMSQEQVRVLRVLEYTGTRAFVEKSLESRAIKGVMFTPKGSIKEAIVGEFPEILTAENEVNSDNN